MPRLQERLPAPDVLRRRHEALVAVEDLLSDSPDLCTFGTDGPGFLWFNSGSGDEYQLVLAGDEAVLSVFDHESPWSPWRLDDGRRGWPGMFDGMPDHLRAHLPARHRREPLSVSDCYWFTGGAWRTGAPAPADHESDYYAGDPGGAARLLAPLLDLEAGVRELVVYMYEEPDRLDEALAVARSIAEQDDEGPPDGGPSAAGG